MSVLNRYMTLSQFFTPPCSLSSSIYKENNIYITRSLIHVIFFLAFLYFEPLFRNYIQYYSITVLIWLRSLLGKRAKREIGYTSWSLTFVRMIQTQFLGDGELMFSWYNYTKLLALIFPLVYKYLFI